MRFLRNSPGVFGFLIAIVALGVLLVVDQRQGGPIGRAYHVKPGSGNEEGVTTHVGKRIWFGGDVIVNTTVLPFHIVSVRPLNSSPGLSIKAGVMMNPPYAGGVMMITRAN